VKRRTEESLSALAPVSSDQRWHVVPFVEKVRMYALAKLTGHDQYQPTGEFVCTTADAARIQDDDWRSSRCHTYHRSRAVAEAHARKLNARNQKRSRTS